MELTGDDRRRHARRVGQDSPWSASRRRTGCSMRRLLPEVTTRLRPALVRPGRGWLMSESEAVTLTDRGRRFAALSGPFDPVVLIEALGDVSPGGGRRRRRRPRERVRHERPGRVADARHVAARRTRRPHRDATHSIRRSRGGASTPSIDATDDLLAALTGTGSYTEDGHLRSHWTPPTDREPLTRMAVALDRAGAHAPASDSRDAVRSAVGRADAGTRAQAMLEPRLLRP